MFLEMKCIIVDPFVDGRSVYRVTSRQKNPLPMYEKRDM